MQNRQYKRRMRQLPLNGETLESRQLLTTTPIWSEPAILDTGVDEVIYVEGADLSGDGIDDAVAAGPNVLYYFSNRDGTFAEPQELTSDGVGYGMTLARDIDNDNDLDVIASSAERGIVVIQNNGDGTFSEGQLITSFSGITRLSTADIDGDGDLDVVSGSYSGKRLAWHENRGDGSFEPDTIVREDVNGLYSVATSDLNGDGAPEIITAEFGDDNAVAMYKNSATNFERAVISNDLNAPLAVEVADIDGDGDEDVVAAAYYGDNIVWYRNDGSANFEAAANSQVTNDVGGPFRVRAADWDNDADLDLISVSTRDDKVAFHENLGGGTFAEQVVLFDNWSGPTAGSAADVDGDGDEDLLIASYADDTLLWVKNDTVRPDSRFTSSRVISDELSAVFVVDAIDLNGDGSRDLLAALTGANQVVWSANDGSGEFGEVQVIGTQAGSPLFAGAADLDGDGDNDVFTTSAFGANEISWYENLGDGAFGEQQIIAAELGEPRWLDAADADGDGDLDLFGSTHDDSRYFWYENRLNEESSDFVLGQVIFTGEGEGANKIFAVDMDEDGDLDAFTASAAPSPAQRPFTWFENDGTGNFSNPTDVAAANVAKYYARPADLDGDGDIDVVATSFVAPLIWYENLGDGTFTSEHVISTGPSGSYGLDVADVDGDGDMDVVTGSYADNEVAWYENNGDGSFSGQQVISRTQSGLFSVVFADIDGDGDEDVVAGSYYDNTAAWYENNPVAETEDDLLPAIDQYATTQHLDISFNFNAGQWQGTVDVDDLGGSDQILPPDQVVVFAVPASATTRPEDTMWDFMGVSAGDPIWVLPQDRNDEIVFPGFAVDRTDNATFARYFESDPRIDSERDWVKIEMVDVRGPEGGQFGTYSTIDRQSEVSLGVWMTTFDGIASNDAFWQREGGHSHVNFFFTQPGVYEVDLKASGFIDVNKNRVFDPGLDVYSESDVSTFYFAVDTPNMAPTITAPSSLNASAGVTVDVTNGTAVQISDTEPSSEDYEVTLRAEGGTLTIDTSNVEVISGDGIEDVELTLRGPLARLNASLETLQFNAGSEPTDAALLQIDVNDQGFFYPDLDGNGSPDNAATASNSVPINIEAARSGRSIGDLDGNGEINFDDFLILSGSFGTEVEPSTSGDVDGNGKVEFTDFLVLSRNFGKQVDEVFAQR